MLAPRILLGSVSLFVLGRALITIVRILGPYLLRRFQSFGVDPYTTFECLFVKVSQLPPAPHIGVITGVWLCDRDADTLIGKVDFPQMEVYAVILPEMQNPISDKRACSGHGI
nr:hypothetical protein CFP56_22494 [Quercus suber]